MKLLKAIAVLLLSLSATNALCAGAQGAGAVSESRDSVTLKSFIAPAALLGGGSAIKIFAHDSFDAAVRETVQGIRPEGRAIAADEYLRFLPFAMGAALAFAVPDAGWGRRGELLLQTGTALVCTAALTKGLKLIVDSPRPDASDSNSFPSGHCALAFAGAELVRIQHGWAWGSAAYVCAIAVAGMRLYNDAHWFSDVLAGAGTGILCAQLSRLILPLEKRLLKMDLALTPTLDPVSGAVCANLAYKF
ncbi:MAG: phosphatase PAP2 family protein [Candidatus Cryptobacteroides sp.]|nr:phosphatase PAP2 family protein [Rikenellaceae bacterium]MDY5745987.1 phosphatase PAP2 family protein [Candidatus Cryptobacteroides sp.]